MICINHFSKMVVLVLFQESDAQTVTSHFLEEVMNHHELPATIISDRDPGIQGNLWEELLKKLNT